MLRRKKYKNVNYFLISTYVIIFSSILFCILSNPIKITLLIPWALSGVFFILWRLGVRKLNQPKKKK